MGKLALRYVGPFEILERVGPIAYRLRLPEELSGVHDTFHVSNLKKCLADVSLHVPLDEIKVDKTLCFVEEPVENSDREVKRFVLVFVEAAKHQILGGDQLLVILCGFGTKSLEFGISFLSMTISGAASYAYSGSLLLTPLCCDDIHDVTPRFSALAGCDRLYFSYFFLPARKKSRWGTVFPTGLKRYKEPLVEPKEIGYSLIPLSRGSFDVIVGMDRLSKKKFVKVCREKAVRIPLEGDEILRVQGERTQGVVKTLMNAKDDELKLSDISVFHIDLVPEATSVAKSRYRLAPLEMQELFEQLRELQDKGFIRPSHFPWRRPCRLLRKEHGVQFEVSVRIIRGEEVLPTYVSCATFSKIVKNPITSLMRGSKSEWGAERKEAF
ncbi:hypothetical protein Tco_0884829 [Tanacetum coccineum]